MYEVKDNHHPPESCPSPVFCWRVLTRPFRMFHPVVWLACGFVISTLVLSGGPDHVDLRHVSGGVKALQGLARRVTRYEQEVKLLDVLKRKAQTYGTDVYPGEGLSDPIKIYFGVSLLFIEDLVNYRFGFGDVTLRCVDRYLWQDERLKWDPADYGGISVVRMPIKNIWAPDIRLLNSLDLTIDEDRDGILALVYHTGKVLFIPPARHRVRCTRNQHPQAKKDRLMEPYDWLCTLKFASWTHDGKALDPDFYPGQKTIDMSDFQQKHGRLKVLNSYVEKKVDKQYKDPYPDLQFHMMLKEKPEGSTSKKAPRKKIPIGKGVTGPKGGKGKKKGGKGAGGAKKPAGKKGKKGGGKKKKGGKGKRL